MISRYLSNTMIAPHQSPVFGDPADHGLEYDDVSFETADGATLRGWMIHGRPDKVIVQVHFGVQSSRSGYTRDGKRGPVKLWKEDIPFLRHITWLNEQGYSVLAYDTRNHGDSTSGPLEWTSWGYRETPDVIAAVEFLEAHPTYGDADIGILGICMGSAETTYAFGLDGGLAGRDNIKAFVAIQPTVYPDMVAGMGLRGFIERRATKVTNERLGMDITETTFLPDVPSIDVPTRLVQNRNDPWANMDFIQRYYDALDVDDKDLVWLDITKGRAAAYAHLGEHPGEILDWFTDRV